MTEVLELELEPDPGWYPVPPDAADVPAWSRELVRALAGADADEDTVRACAEVVRLHADAAHAQLAELALVHLPDPLAPVLAVCAVELVFGRAGELPDLDDVERVLSAQQPDHLEPPEVSRRLLAVGPAVRQRVLRVDEDDDALEQVVHVSRCPGVDDALLRTTTSWRVLGLGEPLAEQADRLAAALQVQAG